MFLKLLNLIKSVISAMLCLMATLLNCTLCAQKTPSIHEGKVIISGKVNLEKNSLKVVSLIYSQLTASPTRLTSILDSTGHFQFEFEIVHPHNIMLRYGGGTAELFVSQSDSLYVTFNSSDFQKSANPNFSVSGANPETSREILKYHRYNKLNSFKPSPAGKSTQEYVRDIQRRIAAEDSVLLAFGKDHTPSEIFNIWVRKDIIYRNANYLVDFEAYHSMHHTTFDGTLYDTAIFPVNDDEALISSWYQYHLWQYALSKYAKDDTTIQKQFKAQQWGEAYSACLKKVIEFERPCIGRDIICYQLLHAISERSFPDYQKLMTNVSYYLNSKPLISLLEAKFKISFLQGQSEAEKEMVGNFMEDLIDRNKGKIIYVDIWATWCGPCKSEIPYAIDLHNQFKDKAIKFVNLCLASDRQAWKRAIENHRIAGENYYFDKDQSDLLTRKLNLAGFPTYLIIGKDGQILDHQAPRPSSGNIIRDCLTKLLE